MKLITRYVSNTLIVGYLAVIYFSGVPESNTFNARMKQKATDIAFVLGIWPSWSMFAPNPIKFDSKTYVEIAFKNGDVKLEDVEIELDGVLATFRKARWMKYSQDNLRSPNQKVLLAPALRFFYNKYNNDTNPIASITLRRKWWDVPAFTEQAPLVPLTSEVKRKESTEVLITEKYGI